MRFRSTVEHDPRDVSIRSGQKRSCPGRGGPLTAARRLGSMLNQNGVHVRALIPFDVHDMVDEGDEISANFLLLYRTLLDVLIPDLPVSHAEAVGVARFCSPNLVRFLFGPPLYLGQTYHSIVTAGVPPARLNHASAG